MTKLSDLDLHEIGNTIQLVGAIYSSGQEKKYYLAWFPDECPPDAFGLPELDDLEMDNEDWKTFIRQTDLLEVKKSVQAEDGSIEKAIVRKSQRQIDAVVSWNVFRRDGYRCRYCGNDKVPLTVDHLILWEDGGPSIEENLVTACKKCNRARGNTPYVAWLASPQYLKNQHKLTEAVRDANQALVSTLVKIPITLKQRSR